MFLLADEDDLHDVISAVMSFAGRWKDLGIFLGVRAGDLDTILANNPHSCSDRLREVVTLWLTHIHIHTYTYTYTYTYIYTYTYTYTYHLLPKYNSLLFFFLH